MRVEDRVAPAGVQERLAARRALRVDARGAVLERTVEVAHQDGRALEGGGVLDEPLDLGEVLGVPALEVPRVGRDAVEVRGQVHAVHPRRRIAGQDVRIQRAAAIQRRDVGEVDHPSVLERDTAREDEAVTAVVAEHPGLANRANHGPQRLGSALADLSHQRLGALRLLGLELGEDGLALVDDAVRQRIALEAAAGVGEAGHEAVLSEQIADAARRRLRRLQLHVLGEVHVRVAVRQRLDRRGAIVVRPDLLQTDEVGVAGLDGPPDRRGAGLGVIDEAVGQTHVPGLDLEDDIVLGGCGGEQPDHGAYQRLRMSM